MSKSRTRGGSSIPSAAVSVKFRGGAPTAADSAPPPWRDSSPAGAYSRSGGETARQREISGARSGPFPGRDAGRASQPGAGARSPSLRLRRRAADPEGRPAQAIAPLKRSVKLNPGVASSHHDLGVAFMNAGRLEQAADVRRRRSPRSWPRERTSLTRLRLRQTGPGGEGDGGLQGGGRVEAGSSARRSSGLANFTSRARSWPMRRRRVPRRRRSSDRDVEGWNCGSAGDRDLEQLR